jgi:5-formyltetrahydrofolate cyclo-ligase
VDKRALREKYKQLRKERFFEPDVVASLREASANAGTIFCYESFGSEVPTHEYIKEMQAQGKRVCVPKVVGDQMVAVVGDEIVHKDDIDLIIVPLLAFNGKNRLGFGGGFYDKYLRGCNARKVGLAFAFQETMVDFMDEWDVELDEVVLVR